MPYDEPVLTPEPVPSASANPIPIPHNYDPVPDLPVAAGASNHHYDVVNERAAEPHYSVPELPPSASFVPPNAPYAKPHPAASAASASSASSASVAFGHMAEAPAAAPPSPLAALAASHEYDNKKYAVPELGAGSHVGASKNLYSVPKLDLNPAAPKNAAAPLLQPAIPPVATAAAAAPPVAAPAAPPVAAAAAAKPAPALAELGTANPDQGIVDATRNQMFPKTPDKKYRTKGMADSDGHYQHEANHASFRGKGPMGNVYTKYWNDAEKDAHQLGANRQTGTLGFLESGNQMNTIGATGQGTWNGEGKDKYIYTMDGKGDMRAVDPAAKNEWARKDMPGLDAPATTNADKQVGLVNHSSTVRGADVAAAGDMTVRDGRLETLSNVSGHYRPDVGMLHQAAHKLGTKGVMNNDTEIDMERGPEGRHKTSALRFLGASQGQEDIAQSAFGTKKATEQTEVTADKKEDLMDEIRRKVPKKP